VGVHPRAAGRQRASAAGVTQGMRAERGGGGSSEMGEQAGRRVSHRRLEALGDALGTAQTEHVHDLREAQPFTAVTNYIRSAE